MALGPEAKKIYDARMKPGKRKMVQREFKEWISDLKYEALFANPAMKAYLFEAFVGGWGSRTRLAKRQRAAEQ
jgi:hypothetical protein